MENLKDFELFARSKGISSNTLNGYDNYIVKNGIVEPYILEERQLNCQPMSVFSRMFLDRIIFLASDVNPDSANIIKAQLLYLNSIGDEDINFFIDSGGGEVISGLGIYDIMNYIKPDVATYCMGMCASMAAVLLSSGAKGKRHSLPNGEIMIHEVATGNSGKFTDIKIAMEHTTRLQKNLCNILAENTGKPYEEVEKDMERDHWFTAQESVEYGLIDEVIKKTK